MEAVGGWCGGWVNGCVVCIFVFSFYWGDIERQNRLGDFGPRGSFSLKTPQTPVFTLFFLRPWASLVCGQFGNVGLSLRVRVMRCVGEKGAFRKSVSVVGELRRLTCRDDGRRTRTNRRGSARSTGYVLVSAARCVRISWNYRCGVRNDERRRTQGVCAGGSCTGTGQGERTDQRAASNFIGPAGGVRPAAELPMLGMVGGDAPRADRGCAVRPVGRSRPAVAGLRHRLVRRPSWTISTNRAAGPDDQARATGGDGPMRTAERRLCACCRRTTPHEEMRGDNGRQLKDRRVLVCDVCGYVTTPRR